MKHTKNLTRTDILLIYLGRRGGGAQLLAEIALSLQGVLAQNLTVFILRAEDGDFLKECSFPFSSLPISRSVKDLICNPFKFIKFLKISFATFVDMKPRWTIFVMPSPLDWFVSSIARLFKSDQLIMIHDFEPHSGESWPSRRSINWRVRKSTKLITFSQHIKNLLLEIDPLKDIEVYSLPSQIHLLQNDSGISVEMAEISGSYILFVGRIRKYKGLEILLEAHKLFHSEKTLVIAGEGKFKKISDSNIRIINRWLSNSEIDFLIERAKVVVFPYTDASQSGLLPIAIAKKKEIIISKLPGLIEQLNDHATGHLVTPGVISELGLAITDAWNAASENDGISWTPESFSASRFLKTLKLSNDQ